MTPRFTVILLATLGLFSASTYKTCATPPGRFSAQLATEADALLNCVTRRSYGWAWDHDLSPESPVHHAARTVSMEPLGSPAAGLILLWTGQLLGEPRYVSAAEQIARGVAAAELPIGRVRTHPVFGPSAGGRDEQVPIADRAASNCGIGLLLATLEARQPSTQPADPNEQTEVDPQTEAFRSAAARCAHWLARQQAPNGLWPSTFPPGPSTTQTIRLVRLDSSDYRDSTLALLLSFHFLHDDTLRYKSTHPLDSLLKLRLTTDVHGPGLWCTACTADGTNIPAGFPSGPDLLASHYAMQTLLAGYIFTQDRDVVQALNAAATTLAQVKRPDGRFDRFLDPTAAADVVRSLGDDVPATQSFFAHPTSRAVDSHFVLADRSTSGSFELPEIIDAASALKSMGSDQYAAALARGFPMQQQIEACLCGLIDDPCTMNFPASARSVPPFLADHNDVWKLTEGPDPDDLPGRVRRLWILFLRAKIERLPTSGG